MWGALTESDSLARWLDPSCELSLKGGSELELAGGSIVVRVRTLQPHQLIELDWETNGEPSLVRFALTTDGSGTMLVLDHERIDEPVGMTYMQLWTNALNRFQP